MSVSVSMPQLGESVTEGTVTRWLKKEGERVEADEPLLEVSTDKVDTEIPSPVAGILRGITVAEDETVAVGAELAIIDETGAEGQAAPPTAAEPPAAEAPVVEAAALVASDPDVPPQPVSAIVAALLISIVQARLFAPIPRLAFPMQPPKKAFPNRSRSGRSLVSEVARAPSAASAC